LRHRRVSLTGERYSPVALVIDDGTDHRKKESTYVEYE
jgi:hypothetical protein